MGRKKNVITKPCSICGVGITRAKHEFRGKPICSKECMAELRRRNMSKEKITKPCCVCGTPVTRSPSAMLKNACCSKECTSVNQSRHMSKLNQKLNPERMTPEMRRKVREGHLALNKGEGKSYPKIYGRHAHRVVMEEKIGRPLKPGEIVHHKDENILNFSPDNLQLLPSQAEHARLHMLKRYYGEGYDGV